MTKGALARGSGSSINILLDVCELNPNKTNSVRPLLGRKFRRWRASSRNDGRWRSTRPGGSVGWVQGRQANGTFNRCLQPHNISVLACLRYSLQATSKLGAIDEVILATPSGSRTVIMGSVCVHVFVSVLCLRCVVLCCGCVCDSRQCLTSRSGDGDREDHI